MKYSFKVLFISYLESLIETSTKHKSVANDSHIIPGMLLENKIL